MGNQNTSKFQFDLETVDEEPPRGNATANSLLLLLLLLLLVIMSRYPALCCLLSVKMLKHDIHSKTIITYQT